MSPTIHHVNGVEIKVGVSDLQLDDREWGPPSKMVCFHDNYRIGDPHDYKQEQYSSWNGLKKAILRDNPNAVILPVYMYDHSGLAFSTAPFSCPWDSGRVGFIFLSLDEIRKMHNIKRVSKKMRKKIEEALAQEVLDYSNSLSQSYYFFQIEDEPSCHGFDSEEEALEQAMVEIGA